MKLYRRDYAIFGLHRLHLRSFAVTLSGLVLLGVIGVFPAGAKEESIHPPWKDKPCQTCHQPGKAKSVADTLCLACHSQETYARARRQHPAVEGGCQACHQGHRSPYPDLLKGNPLEFCYTCHGEQRSARTHPMGMRDPLTGGTLNCTSSCHKLHDAPFSDLLRKERGRALCVSCHGDKIP